MHFDERVVTGENVKSQTRKRRTKRDPGIDALGKFVRVLETQNPDAQRAAILWLADRFLGMKPRHWL